MTTLTCYVCGGELKEVTERYARSDYFLPTVQPLKHITSPVYIGKDTYRHRRCEPGGARWMEIQGSLPRRKRSEFYEMFLLGKVKHENKIQEHKG
jgi:hypothetical protein